PQQGTLPRVLLEREFYPVGAERPIHVKFRLITATNRDLWSAVNEGKFREDLYYRIHVIPIFLPPLRERREDIPLLAHHFLQRFSREMHKSMQDFAAEAMQYLMLHNWPGNIRELLNGIQCADVLAPSDFITRDLLLLRRY